MKNAALPRLSIRESVSGEILAEAESGAFQEIEGNWYVEPSAVNTEHLRITSHEYRCPYKGRCLYVDYDDGERTVPRVAWVYDEIEPGWEHVRGKYGFYAGGTARKLRKTRDSIS
jgi:uncharacterized protein (DUF427 family)